MQCSLKLQDVVRAQIKSFSSVVLSSEHCHCIDLWKTRDNEQSVKPPNKLRLTLETEICNKMVVPEEVTARAAQERFWSTGAL